MAFYKEGGLRLYCDKNASYSTERNVFFGMLITIREQRYAPENEKNTWSAVPDGCMQKCPNTLRLISLKINSLPLCYPHLISLNQSTCDLY